METHVEGKVKFASPNKNVIVKKLDMFRTEETTTVSEAVEGLWSFHISLEGRNKSLCGVVSRPTNIPIDRFGEIGTVFEKPCQACQVLAFGWPENITSKQNHPLFIATLLLSVYDSYDDIESRVTAFSKNWVNPKVMAAGILVLRESKINGVGKAAEKASALWSLVGNGEDDYDKPTHKRLVEIFTDFHSKRKKYE